MKIWLNLFKAKIKKRKEEKKEKEKSWSLTTSQYSVLATVQTKLHNAGAVLFKSSRKNSVLMYYSSRICKEAF